MEKEARKAPSAREERRILDGYIGEARAQRALSDPQIRACENEYRHDLHRAAEITRRMIEALTYPAGVGHIEGGIDYKSTGRGERDRQGIAWVELIDATGTTCLIREQEVPEIDRAHWAAVLEELSRETSRDLSATPRQ